MLNKIDQETIVSYVENLIVGVCLFCINGDKITPVYLNEGCYRMLGYTHQELDLLLKHIEQNIVSADLPTVKQGITDILKDDGPVDFAFRTVTLSGALRWLQINGNLYTRTAEEAEIICVLTDITEKKFMEEEMLEQAERLNLIVESEQEIIVDYNAKTDVMMIRKIARNGMPKEEIIPKYFEDLDLLPYHPDDVDRLLGLYRQLLKKAGKGVIEYRNKRFTEDYHWFQLALSSISDVDGYVTRIVGRMLDIQDRKLKELELTNRAEKDSLSGLYNKGAVTEMITREIMQSEVETIHALMIVDLDNFKHVNDTLGHIAGDRLIEAVSARFLKTFKEYDIIGRVGGDEFVVFLKDIETIANADILATKLLKGLQDPYTLAHGDISITCSIGISIYPYHGVNFQELFDKADKAMYYIKDNGKNSYRIFDAAATRVFHASRRSARTSRYIEKSSNMEPEDLILDILYEEKDKQAAFEAVLQLIATQYEFQRAYVYPALSALKNDYPDIYYMAQGFELDESQKEKICRAMIFESLCNFENRFLIRHDYDTNLTEEQLRYMAEGKIHGLIYYPFIVNGKYVGCIIFERHTWKDIVFYNNEDKLLQSIMRILDAYIQNTGILNKVPNIITQIKLIDNLDNYVYVVDSDTMCLSFVNKKVLEKTPDIRLGEKCYKVFRNLDIPCEDCVLKKMSRDNPHSRCTDERFNYSTRTWMRLSASWLECTQDVALCMMDCVDISEYFIGP